MSDEELKKYIPQEGDRVAIRSAVRKRTEKGEIADRLKERLKERMECKTSKKAKSDCKPSMNAVKHQRSASFYWSHFDSEAGCYKSIGKNRYGGQRIVTVSKEWNKSRLIAEAKCLYFEDGISTKGAADDMCNSRNPRPLYPRVWVTHAHVMDPVFSPPVSMS